MSHNMGNNKTLCSKNTSVDQEKQVQFVLNKDCVLCFNDKSKVLEKDPDSLFAMKLKEKLEEKKKGNKSTSNKTTNDAIVVEEYDGEERRESSKIASTSSEEPSELIVDINSIPNEYISIAKMIVEHYNSGSPIKVPKEIAYQDFKEAMNYFGITPVEKRKICFDLREELKNKVRKNAKTYCLAIWGNYLSNIVEEAVANCKAQIEVDLSQIDLGAINVPTDFLTVHTNTFKKFINDLGFNTTYEENDKKLKISWMNIKEDIYIESFEVFENEEDEEDEDGNSENEEDNKEDNGRKKSRY